MLTEKIKEEFYIRIYFNTDDGFEIAGLKRAYLDFNRTLVIADKNKENRDRKRFKTERFLEEQITKLISLEISTQETFDKQHKLLCENLVNEWSELSFGQAQKWINMTMKYWLLFGNERIKNIEKNSAFFHIPIDSYVQKGMFKEKSPKPWSKINSYEKYFDYQLKHREEQTGNPPLLDEFIFFNEYK